MRTVSIDSLRERIRNAHPRTRKAQVNTVLGLVTKGGGMIISLLLVPLTIDYLSKDTYGTWLTISSIVTMMMFVDVGIGNGLRNKFSEAIANQNVALARGYVSTAYSLFGIIQLSFICFFLIIVRYVPWQRVFNTSIDLKQLQTVMLLTVVAMAIKLVLDMLSCILFALQESSRAGMIAFLSNGLVLIGTYVLARFTKGNLVYLAAITAAIPVFVLLISGIVLYQGRLKIYRPLFRLINVSHAKSLLSLGYKFFFIQIAVIIIFYTDNLIITQLFGPAEVAVYNVSFRYFNAMTTLFLIVIAPYWSAFTEASVKKDFHWMRQTYNHLQRIWLFFLGTIILMVIIAEKMYSVWIGDRLVVPTMLNVVMGASAAIICWNNLTVAVTNGLGKVKIQLVCSVLASLVNIPLSIYFGRELNMGSAGVILATCMCLIPGLITGSIQAKKLINDTARGTWAK